jgi:5-methylcytosine-specific restriction endonuclease McrA
MFFLRSYFYMIFLKRVMQHDVEEMIRESAIFKSNCIKVLLLDRDWQPMGVVTWQKAMTLILSAGKVRAQVVQEYADKVIHSVNQTFQVPSVVRVFGISQRRKIIPCNSDNVFYRDEYRCAYCGRKCLKKDLTIDHIFPVVQGGQDSWKNLITACGDCNRKKGGRTPKQANMPLLYRPKEPKWSMNFYLKLNRSDPIKDWSEYLYGLDETSLSYQNDDVTSE